MKTPHVASLTSSLFSFLFMSMILGCAPYQSNLTANFASKAQTNSDFDPNATLLTGPFKGFKSTLDFSGVTWPSQVPGNENIVFELGLDITGSFEGNSGWANLTNNFDGQGLSMGILNQTLGTGSLQPLLIQMQKTHLPTLQRIFSPAHLQTLLAMLNQYGKATLSSQHQMRSLASPANDDEPVSLLDTESDFPSAAHARATTQAAASPESASVNWAVNNLYNGTKFQPDWARELTALCNDPDYVSFQIGAALSLFTRARSYQHQLNLNDLHAFLFFFDVMVQNGGMYSQDITDYKAWLNSQPNSTSTARLNELLTLRLRHVKAAYVSDVAARKSALITGSGTVHGAHRDFSREFGISLETNLP